MEQPNVTGDGEAALTPRFWLAVVATGIAAGLLGDLMMVILFHVQRLAFGYRTGSFESGVEAATAGRRVVVLALGGAFAGLAWYLVRRCTPGERSEVDEAVWHGDGTLSFRRSLLSSTVSEVVIGMGASIGREAAPKLLGGASASVLAGAARLSIAQRRLLVACGAGAGLAAVYNVPLGGTVFVAEVLFGTITLPVVLPAAACCAVATLTAWLYLPTHATYVDIPDYRLRAALLAWAVLAGPLIGLAASGYIRLIGWVSYHQARGAKQLGAPLLAFSALGLVGIQYPQLFGNGKDMAHDVLVGGGSLALLAALAALKPLVTCLCLGSGASGGLFTPVLSTGAALGGFLGLVWSHLWPGSTVGAYAMVGAAAMLGAGMQAPISALVLVPELTHSGLSIMLPMLLATVGATAVSRYVDGYSIYSARLAAATAEPAEPDGGERTGAGGTGTERTGAERTGAERTRAGRTRAGRTTHGPGSNAR